MLLTTFWLLNMPGLRGQTVLEHLAGSLEAPSIIIVSGNNDEAEARALLQGGAFDYITKPVDLAHLRIVIAMAAAAAPSTGG